MSDESEIAKPDVDSDPAEQWDAVITASNRGPLHIHCNNCEEFKRSRSIPIQRSNNNGHRRFKFIGEPDIAWFRRLRVCTGCGNEFYTGEIDERMIEELFRLRQNKEKGRRVARNKITEDVRSKRKLLRTTGDKIPRDLAAELVRKSAWWLTHSSGTPVRAPGHADRLYELRCGWSVDFGANSFAAARALAISRDYAGTMYDAAIQGKLPSETTIRKRLRAIPSECVLNVKGDFYDSYPTNGSNELVFGAQAIDVKDCEHALMQLTGLADLITAYSSMTEDE